MKKILGVIVFVLLGIGIFNYGIAAQNDLLEQSFEDAKSNDTVVDMGSSSEAVGGYIFKGGIKVGLDGIKKKEPLLVRVSKFILKITVAIGITMFLVGGIMYLLSMGDQGAMRKAMKNLIIAGAGIILSLLSMAIIDLITSISSSIRI